MSTEDDLFKAYMILGLLPGTEWQAILTRYKRQVMVWHPDRVPDNAAWREEATEELKKFNWARDVLKLHFEDGSHTTSSDCACRQRKNSEAERNTGGPGPGRKGRPSSEPPDFSAFTQGQTRAHGQNSEPTDTSNSRMQESMKEKKLLQDQSLRWKVATALGIAYVSLCLFGITANSAKDTWSEWTKSWQKKEVPKASEPIPSQPVQPPVYVPPYNQFPGGNSSRWQDQQSEDRRLKEEAAQKKKEQDLYFAKLEVDRYETAIAYNNKEITQIDIKLADPSIAETTRRQLQDIREYRVRSLSEAQSFLKAAQEKVSGLDPTYAPAYVPAQTPLAPYSPSQNMFNGNSGNSLPFTSTSPTSSLHDRLKERKLFP